MTNKCLEKKVSMTGLSRHFWCPGTLLKLFAFFEINISVSPGEFLSAEKNPRSCQFQIGAINCKCAFETRTYLPSSKADRLSF